MPRSKEKCKWCGQPMHTHDGVYGCYCGKTCQILAAEEDPMNIRRRRVRQLSLVVGAVYSLILAAVGGTLYPRSFLFYISLGALIGWTIGIGLGWLVYYLSKQHEQNLKEQSIEQTQNSILVE